MRFDGWLRAFMRRLTARTASDLSRTAIAGARDPTGARIRGLLDDAQARPFEDVALATSGDSDGFALTLAHLAFLARLVRDGGITRVLEFGAGHSTVVLATALAEQGGGSVTTIEQAPESCRDDIARASAVPGADVRLVHGVTRMAATPAGCVRVFAGLDPAVGDRAPFDLVVIDAPYWRQGREGALHAAVPYLRRGGLLVLDDAARPSELWVLRRILAACPGLRLVLYDEQTHFGIAALQLTGSPRVVRSPRLVLDSFMLSGLLGVARLTGPPLRWQT